MTPTDLLAAKAATLVACDREWRPLAEIRERARIGDWADLALIFLTVGGLVERRWSELAGELRLFFRLASADAIPEGGAGGAEPNQLSARRRAQGRISMGPRTGRRAAFSDRPTTDPEE